MDLLSSIKECKTQLPDFQRGWVWNDERIRELLNSISQSYPIGAIMMLQTGNPNVRFVTRPVEGVENPNNIEPERLILDGQQRLTSIFQSMMQKKAVKTKNSTGKVIKRFYYLDIDKILDENADRDEAIIGIPENRILKGQGNKIVGDYSDIQKECEAGMLPVSTLFDAAQLLKWQTKYFSNPEKLNDRANKWQRLMMNVFPKFQSYQIPVIMLRKHIPKEAVCQVFENVNTGGVSLTVFELLTATFAADNYQLRDNWEEKEQLLKNSGQIFNKILANVSSSDFLQSIALITTYNKRKLKPTSAIGCKRKDILQLELVDYKNWTVKLTQGCIEAAKFLNEQNVFSVSDLPYGSQLIPLSAIFVELGSRANDFAIRQKIARWYWCGVLGELYGGSSDTRFAKDLPEVIDWINGGSEPSTIVDSNFASDRLLSLKSRNSAAYKGIHVLMMKDGGRDFISGVTIDIQTYYGEGIDIHHIFPKAFCDLNGIDTNRRDSIVNKAPISYKTNRSIGGNKPSVYLKRIETQHNIVSQSLDLILQSHKIEVSAIRNDNFNVFFENRRVAIIKLIEKITGKNVV